MTPAQLLLALPCLVSAGVLGTASLAPRARTDPDKLYQRRAFQAAVKLNGFLYIEGGEKSFYLDSGEKEVFDGKPYQFDSDGWGGNTTKYIPLNKRWKPAEIEYATIPYATGQKNVRFPALWVGDNVLYRWGGELLQEANYSRSDNDFVSLDPSSSTGEGSWQVFSGNTISDDIKPTSNAATTSCDGVGYSFGGIAYGGTSPLISAESKKESQSGMFMFNTSTKAWRASTTNLSIPGATHRHGAAVCVPGFLDYSLVALLGGTVRDTKTQRSLKKFTFFDPIDDRWRTQVTTDYPSSRDTPCAVGVRSKMGTYEIYMYGGLDSSGVVLSDVYVLSIPLFRWFKVTPPNTPKRRLHSCVVGSNRLMISYGGINAKTDTPAWKSQDPWANTLGILDMNTLQWRDEFDPNLGDYEMPEEIRKAYDDGGVAKVQWDDPEVKSIFMKNYSGPNPTDTTDTPGPTNSPTNSPSSSDDGSSKDGGTPVGAIAGGIVGGLLGLALIGALVWFLLRRRRQKESPHHVQSPDTPKELYGGPPPVETEGLAVQSRLENTKSAAPPSYASHAGPGMYYELQDTAVASELASDTMGSPTEPSPFDRPSPPGSFSRPRVPRK